MLCELRVNTFRERRISRSKCWTSSCVANEILVESQHLWCFPFEWTRISKILYCTIILSVDLLTKNICGNVILSSQLTAEFNVWLWIGMITEPTMIHSFHFKFWRTGGCWDIHSLYCTSVLSLLLFFVVFQAEHIFRQNSECQVFRWA